MFFEKLNEDEFFTTLESGMHKFASFEEDLEDNRLNNVLNHLTSAARQLANAELIKEAQLVVKLKEVCEDPAMSNLTPNKMLNNLAEKGWVFNAKDGGHNPDMCNIDDCSMCSEGEQPQLSQPELKQLRQLLQSDSNDDMDKGDKEGIEGMFENMNQDDRKSMLNRLVQKYK